MLAAWTERWSASGKSSVSLQGNVKTKLQREEIDFDDPWQAVEGFPSCFLITDAILSDETENYTVKGIDFTIKSNDQGWTSEDNYNGVYEGSWTWFEVAILREAKDGAKISSMDKRRIDSERCIQDHLKYKGISTQLQLVAEGGGPFWHLQRNRRGDDEPKEHKINWKRDAKLSESERTGWDFNSENGSGSGVGFVELLQKNDRVAIIACAKNSESVNYILRAGIQMSFEYHPNKYVPSQPGDRLDTPKDAGPDLGESKSPTSIPNVTTNKTDKPVGFPPSLGSTGEEGAKDTKPTSTQTTIVSDAPADNSTPAQSEGTTNSSQHTVEITQTSKSSKTVVSTSKRFISVFKSGTKITKGFQGRR